MTFFTAYDFTQHETKSIFNVISTRNTCLQCVSVIYVTNFRRLKMENKDKTKKEMYGNPKLILITQKNNIGLYCKLEC